MAAPSSVYKDLKLVDDTTLQDRELYVAAYLQNTTPTTGSEWGNGYFNASDIPVGSDDRTTANDNIKGIFKLDAIYPVASGSTTTGAGFIGAISCDAAGNLLGSNAFFHSGSRYSGMVYQSGSNARYRLLNDGGLNRKPDASVGTGVTWANYVEANLTYESPYYNEIEDHGFMYKCSSYPAVTQSIGSDIPRKQVKTVLRVIRGDNSPDIPTPPTMAPDLYSGVLVSGSTVQVKVYADNEESEAVEEILDSMDISVGERIRFPFDTWNYWSSEPTSMGSPVTSYTELHFYENAFRDLWSVPEIPRGSPPSLPTGTGPMAYSTKNLNFGAVASPGWYANGNIKRLVGSPAAESIPAFYVAGVNSPGEIVGFKALDVFAGATRVKIKVNFVEGPLNVGETPYYLLYYYITLENCQIDNTAYPYIRLVMTPSATGTNIPDYTDPTIRGFTIHPSGSGALGGAVVVNTNYSLDGSLIFVASTPALGEGILQTTLYQDNPSSRRLYPGDENNLGTVVWDSPIGRMMFMETSSGTPIGPTFVTRALTSSVFRLYKQTSPLAIPELETNVEFIAEIGTLDSLT